MIGQTISHYKITSKLGEGGMGVVYKAEDLKLPRFVALKFLPPHLSTDEGAKRRFVHEAEAASALDHPNIGTIYEIDETPDGQMFIAMAHYEGQTLKQKLAAGPVGIDEAIDIVSQIASGLAKAHESDILHRDVKPANVLLTNDGHAKIVDFGLAKLAGRTRVTRTGTTVGTVSYMSPEQASGDDVDSRSDVFSAGVVLYEFLTGKLPFRGDHEAAVVYSIMNVDPEPLAAHREDLPEDAQRVIDKALAKDRDERYESASDLLADLKRLQEGRQVAALEKRATKKAGRRAAVYAALAIVVIVAGYAAITRLVPRDGTTPSEQAPAVSPTTVAVLPFAVRGNDEFADMGEGMMDLLSTKLDGAGTLRSVDSRALLSFIKRKGGGSSDPELGRQVAEEFGAGLYLLGDIMAVGERLHVNASLYEPGGGLEPVAEATVEGDAIQILGMVDDLAAQLLMDRLGGNDEFRYDLDAITTKSYPALKAYLDGEARSRGGNPGTAIEAFQRAVDEDSTFALAWYSLALAWTRMAFVYETVDMIRGLADRAESLSAGLPRLDRLRVQALREDVYQNDDEAEQLYKTIVSNSPDDFESWLALGTLQADAAYRRGRSLSESREALERAYALDSDDWRIVYQLGWLSSFERDYDNIGLLSDEPPYSVLNRALLAFGAGDSAAQDTALTEMAGLDNFWLAVSVGIISTFTDNLVRSMDVARLLTESRRPDDVRGQGHVFAAYLEASRGRWRAAKQELKSAETLNPVLTIEHGSLLAAAPFLPISEAELRSVRDALDAWDAASVPPSKNPSYYLRIHDEMHPHLRLYLLGIVDARLGNLDRAVEYAEQIEQMGGPTQVTDLMRDLAHGIRARVYWAQGNDEKALEQFEHIQMKSPTNVRIWSPFLKQSHERYLRAELLHEMGRDEEALGWTNSIGDLNGIEFVYRAPIHLRRAEYYDRTGQPAKAAENYAAFIEIWKDCDEELRPFVNEAESRLSALTVEEG